MIIHCKKSLKAFTLMELVVVLSIIAILSMVLVPNIIEYTRNAKIRTANSNAEIIYRAAQDWLVEQEIDHRDIFPSTNPNPSSAFLRSSASKVQAPGQGSSEGSGIEMDIEQYISNMVSIEGEWRVVIDPDSYKCLYAIWTQQDNTGALKTDADLFFNNESKQRDYLASSSSLIGVYPYKDDT